MKLAVSHDENGNIVTLFDPEKLRGDKGFLRYVPARGERHHVLQIPNGFENRPFEELAGLLRVNASSAHPRLEPKV